MLRPMTSHGLRKLAIVTTTTLIAVSAASALAAHVKPKPGGKFSGTTSAQVNVYGAPVSFTVATDGKKLTAFRYDTFGCFGAGGFGKGNPYKNAPGTVERIGTITVSSNATFSSSSVKTTYTSKQGYKTVTTSKVAGRFTSSTSATGTITYSQTLARHGKPVNGGHCGPVTVTFTATAR